MSSARVGWCGRRLGRSASCGRISETERCRGGSREAAPARRGTGVPGAASRARQARCPGQPARCGCPP
ncbi:hypothetical protein GRJ2_001882200 [Grus japonensis]|uniref:Uncharacterized protein n=1 Tax=Grus japonensis TaxID=30415 RepID=A0ABC9XAU0_GRUJA